MLKEFQGILNEVETSRHKTTTGVKLCDVICKFADHNHRSIFLTRESQL
jgi:hypothetical protein